MIPLLELRPFPQPSPTREELVRAIREAVPPPEIAEHIPARPVVGEDGWVRLRAEWRIGRK